MQSEDPPFLTVGTEVSAKYKGAFCEAKVHKVAKVVKIKVTFKSGFGSAVVSDENVKGIVRVGSEVKAFHIEKNQFLDAIIGKVQDCSQYTVVFDDGDITTLRRSSLCMKSGRHFAESETLDQLPLTHPEHFGTPVVSSGRKGTGSSRRLRQAQDSDESTDEEEGRSVRRRHRQCRDEWQRDIGKVVCVEIGESRKRQRDNWFPGLVVAPTAQDSVKIETKKDYLVRSFHDGRYYTVPKKEATMFTREMSSKLSPGALKVAVEKVLLFLGQDELPPHWDRDLLFGTNVGEGGSESGSDSADSDNSDGEPSERKDHFVAQLYKFMEECGTPLNKGPAVGTKDLDLYRLFKIVQHLGGFNRVMNQNQWKTVVSKMGLQSLGSPGASMVRAAYKRYLQNFEDFNRKLGCTMVSPSKGPRGRHPSLGGGRSLIRDKDKTPRAVLSSTCAARRLGVGAESSESAGEELEKKEEKEKGGKSVKREMKKEDKNEEIKQEEKCEEIIIKKGEKKDEVKKEDAKKEDTKKEEIKPQDGKRTKVVATDPPVSTVDISQGSKGLLEAALRERLPREPRTPRGKFHRGTPKVAEVPVEVVRGRGAGKHRVETDSEDEAEMALTRSSRTLRGGGEELRDDDDVIRKAPGRRGRLDRSSSVSSTSTAPLPCIVGVTGCEKKVGKEGIKVKTPSGRTSSAGSGEEGVARGKRGVSRKKREEGEMEDVVASVEEKETPVQTPAMALTKSLLPANVTVNVGDRLKVLYGPNAKESKVTYEAKVLQVTAGEGGGMPTYYVHYLGWNNRYDEWVKHPRVAENVTWSLQHRVKKSPRRSHSSAPGDGGSKCGDRKGRSGGTEDANSSSPRSAALKRMRTYSGGIRDHRDSDHSDSSSSLVGRRKVHRGPSRTSHSGSSGADRQLEIGGLMNSESEEMDSDADSESDQLHRFPTWMEKQRISENSEGKLLSKVQPLKEVDKRVALAPPCGKDIDLKAIESEMKGLDKPSNTTIKKEGELEMQEEINILSDKKPSPDILPGGQKGVEGQSEEQVKFIAGRKGGDDDIYEFKEPEPFDFGEMRSRKETRGNRTSMSPIRSDESDSELSGKKGKVKTRKGEGSDGEGVSGVSQKKGEEDKISPQKMSHMQTCRVALKRGDITDSPLESDAVSPQHRSPMSPVRPDLPKSPLCIQTAEVPTRLSVIQSPGQQQLLPIVVTAERLNADVAISRPAVDTIMKGTIKVNLPEKAEAEKEVTCAAMAHPSVASRRGSVDKRIRDSSPVGCADREIETVKTEEKERLGSSVVDSIEAVIARMGDRDLKMGLDKKELVIPCTPSPARRKRTVPVIRGDDSTDEETEERKIAPVLSLPMSGGKKKRLTTWEGRQERCSPRRRALVVLRVEAEEMKVVPKTTAVDEGTSGSKVEGKRTPKRAVDGNNEGDSTNIAVRKRVSKAQVVVPVSKTAIDDEAESGLGEDLLCAETIPPGSPVPPDRDDSTNLRGDGLGTGVDVPEQNDMPEMPFASVPTGSSFGGKRDSQMLMAATAMGQLTSVVPPKYYGELISKSVEPSHTLASGYPNTSATVTGFHHSSSRSHTSFVASYGSPGGNQNIMEGCKTLELGGVGMPPSHFSSQVIDAQQQRYTARIGKMPEEDESSMGGASSSILVGLAHRAAKPIPSAGTTAGLVDNTPPTTPESIPSNLTDSPSRDNDLSKMDDSSKSGRDSSEVESESFPDNNGKLDQFSEDSNTMDSAVNGESGNRPRLQLIPKVPPRPVAREGGDGSEDDGVIASGSSCRHRKRTPRARGSHVDGDNSFGSPSFPPSAKKRQRHSSARGAKEGLLDLDTGGLSPLAYAACNINVQCRYNFCQELDPDLDASNRIDVLQQRIQELKKTYVQVKGELASIERRRRKLRKKDLEKDTKMEES